MKLEAQRYAKEALEDFDPNRGFALASYITTSVKQKLYRYVSTHQNVARIPQYQIDQIGPLREATADLTQKFGHEPSAAQLADHMGVPLAHVAKLRRILRKDLLEEAGGVEDAGAIEHDADYEKAMLAYYSMSEVEKLVFDYTLGAHGQGVLSTNELASKLKITAGRISQIKKRIAEKIVPYLGSTGIGE
jgi:RNA polymerase sigma factor (sigma-70 family)